MVRGERLSDRPELERAEADLIDAIVDAVVIDDEGDATFEAGATDALAARVIAMTRAGDGAEAMDSVLDAIGVLTAQGAPRAADALIDMLLSCGAELVAALDDLESAAGAAAQRRFASFMSEREASADPRLDASEALAAHLLGGKRRI